MKTRRPLLLLPGLLVTGCHGIRIEVLEPLSSSRFDAQACVETALSRNPDPRDLPLALAHFRQACADGDGAGCSTLGLMYERGLGVVEDEVRAAKLYQRACAAGNEAGCVHLGRAYIEGRGVPLVVEKATALYSAACRSGHAAGCTELARLHLRGEGLMRSPRHAAPLFDRACESGDADACFELGGLHEKGVLERDTLRTLMLYERACAGGLMPACEGVARVQQLHRPIAELAITTGRPATPTLLARKR
jgi:TPR repeat protein